MQEEEKNNHSYPIDTSHSEPIARLKQQPDQEQQTFLKANMLQVAVLNKMLPKGFKFELADNGKK